MSQRLSTAQIIKERLSVLAVIFVCLALAVIAQAAVDFFSREASPPVAAATPAGRTATPRPTAAATRPPGAQASPGGPTSPAAPASPVSLKSVNLTGNWQGAFTETVDGSPITYQYALQLAQQGGFVSGKATLQKKDDPTASARFVVKGQVIAKGGSLSVQFTEELLGLQKLNAGSAIAPRTTWLDYVPANGQDTLVGEWTDRRYADGHVTGALTLTRQ